MTHLQTLASEKYWQVLVKDDAAAQRRWRNQKAVHDFMTFLFGLGAMALGTYLVQHQQLWLPALQSFVNSLHR